MLKKSFFGKKLTSGFQEIHYSCTVNFLDERDPLTVTFQKDTLGRQLIDHVCSSLDLAEKDYFGLRFVDKEKQRHWLDPKKPAYRQLKNAEPMVLCFRVKYYPSDPFKLKEELTRYLLFLQLERDLLHGRLLCTQDEMASLTAYLLQAKLGDFDAEKMTPEHLLKSNLVPKSADLEKVISCHSKLQSVPIIAAEENFVKVASELDTYGVDPHPVKDPDGNPMYVGLSHTGIVTFHGNKKADCFLWKDISRLDFEGKNFIIHTLVFEAITNKKKKQVHSFKCPSPSACKHLWKCAVEQQCFFTLESGGLAQKMKGNRRLFRRSSTFKFSGLSESEIWLSTTSLNRVGPVVQRSASNPYFFRNSHGYETLPASFKLGSYHLASGESLESTSTSSMIVPGKAVNQGSVEDATQKSPMENDSKNDSAIVEQEMEEMSLRNNLEQVIEGDDDDDEAVEEVKCEASSGSSMGGLASPPAAVASNGLRENEAADDAVAEEEVFKNCDVSNFMTHNANNTEFFDLVEEKPSDVPVPPVRHNISVDKIIFAVFVVLSIALILFNFMGPMQNSYIYSMPGQFLGFLKDILCQLGF